MRRSRIAHRPLALITIVVFLPLATGCGTARTVAVPTDPRGEDDPFRNQERLAVTGYVDTRGTDHDWNGFVRSSGADSLEFMRGEAPAESDDGSRSMKLAREEVARVLVEAPRTTRSTLLSAGVLLAIVTLGFVGLKNLDMDLSLGSVH